MTKKIIGFILILIVSVHTASAEEVFVDKELWEKILQRQDALEKEVRQLKEQLKEKAVPDQKATEYLKEDVEDMSDRLDKVEKASILDKIQLGGEFRTQLNYFDMDNIHRSLTGDGQEKDGRTDELWQSRLRLSLRSDITRNLIFHGRLTWHKYWGDTNDEAFPVDSDYSMLSDREGNVHVERAYFDYFIPKTPLALTVGRLPLSNGPPYEFKNNTTRKATWTQLFVDGEYDGIISTLHLEKWTGLKDAVFRLGYCKASQNYMQYQGVELDSMRAAYLSVESEVPGVKDSLLWLGAYKLFDLIPLHTIPGVISHPPDSGTYENYTLHLQLDNIADTGLGWFGSFSYQNIHPRKEGTKFASGYEIGLFGDNLHGDLGKRRDGYGVYTGLRYILPIGSLKHPHIGFEYNYGSKYWLPGSIAGGEFTNKLSIIGSAYEFYYIQPIHEKYMFCRFGAVYQDYDYYNPLGGIFGSMDDENFKTDMSIFHTYFLVDVRF